MGIEYFLSNSSPDQQAAGCIVVGIYEPRTPSPSAVLLDQASKGHITAILDRGDMQGKPGSTLLLHNVPGIAAERVLLVGLGKEGAFDAAAYRKATATAARALRDSTGASDAVSYLTHLPVSGKEVHFAVEIAALETQDSYYRFDRMKGAETRAKLPTPTLQRVGFDLPPQADRAAAEAGFAHALAIGQGVSLAKDLGNLPGNVCTPTYLAETAQALAAEYPTLLRCTVLEESDMERLGMGSLLSVTRGSRQPAKLICLEYRNAAEGEKPVALVGKGLTFDSGGISIKPGAKMDEMKFDMCGGAAVLGAVKTLCELKLPINLVGVVVSSENMPDGQASKPGDIVTSMAGITIEILNTDAEGRLILCDALTYTERTYNPAVCIDMATLTGACVMGLGQFPSGLFSNTPALAQSLLAAGDAIGDKAWELPLWPEYEDNIKSECADIANIATKGEGGGAIIGATFLHKFTKKMQWAHLDIAGTAWMGKKATGRPVPLLAQYLIGYAARKDA